MKLPDAQFAIISEAKLVEYLLSPTHRRGKSKAAFFTASGFSQEHWMALADALRRHILDHEVSALEETTFGLRYIIEGKRRSPTGRDLQVRTIWFIDQSTNTLRFVTAYPLKRKKS